jgi:FMN phosphatase YigB (HAD superfamily)
MAITTILFDDGGVLYHRPRADRHLAAFLQEHGLALRHRSAVARALRAARFDVQSGRIPREAFFDAVLRVHGVQDERLFPAGREALLADAADIELFPGVREMLGTLYRAGFRLGVVSDTAHPAHDKMAWLAQRGIAPEWWAAFAVSSESGMLKPGGASFERALAQLSTAPREAAFVGHDAAELGAARDLGLTTIAFLPDDPAAHVDHAITSFYGLQALFVPGEGHANKGAADG